MRGIGGPDWDIIEIPHTCKRLFKKKKPCYACIRDYEMELGFIDPETREPPEDNLIFS